MKIYNTDEEEQEFNLIKNKYPFDAVINPKEFFCFLEIKENSYKIMKFCLNFIKKYVDMLIFSQYKDFIGRGVYEEIKEAKNKNIPIFFLYKGEFYSDIQCSIFDPNDWAISYAKVSITNCRK